MAALFKDRICAVVAAPTAREMQTQFRHALKFTRTVELRLDYLEGPAKIGRFLRWLGNARPRADMIATCRRLPVGGRFEVDKTNQFLVLHSAWQCGCRWSDVEIESIEDSSWKLYFLGDKRVVISHHNFETTPANLGKEVRRLGWFNPHAVKMATYCLNYRDVLRLLSLCKGRRDVIAVPMGEIGLPARVLALKHGSALAYASVGEKTAPGQLTLDEMKNLYRADKLDRRTKVYGVIGNPVAHSLSPQMHNAGFHARRINAVYLPFLVQDLRDFLRAVPPLEIAGFSVTLPWKEIILRHLDECDPLAARIGAVNTVIVRGNGTLYGRNTDYVGVLRALERRVPLAGSRVLILGAGGAARAVAFALAQGGAIVCICARRPEQAQKLARDAGGEFIKRAHVRREFFDAIVNTTPVGMHPRTGESPLAARELNTRLVFDAVYRPQRTKLLQFAERRVIETVSGIEMFIAQGTAQWEIWMGQRAPEKVMRRAVMAALRKEIQG